jgi:pullulanase
VDADLLRRKATAFVLWRPAVTTPPPRMIIGRLQPGNPPALTGEQSLPLRPAGGGLWELPAGECGLVDSTVYHYWFEVTDTNPAKATHPRIRCTDPTAWTVDWRLLAPRLAAPFDDDDRDPAGVVKWEGSRLVPCDPAGEVPDWGADPPLDRLPPNHRLVIYELPTAWSRLATPDGHTEVSVGTFRDVAALVEAADAAGHPAPDHLRRLGVNALELLPPADSFVDREWGYATSNYFAPDYDLGFPEGHASPTASVDLARLVVLCHRHGIRFFADVVMAFATRYAYQNVNFLDFHVQSGAGDPEEWANGRRRDGFGGDLFKYNYRVTGYDPLAGDTRSLVPARRLMQTFLVRWLRDFRVDGLRLDSVENIANWDFVQECKDLARQVWRERGAAQGLSPTDADARFLVVGEELAVPLDLLRQGRLDGLWNEHFKRLVRHAILGETDAQEPSFEWTIRKLIDCRLLGFADGTQAVNYVTSHDVGGFRNERLQNFLNSNAVAETEQRIKLAFVCLLTAVGVPMILAGEEFGDEHDLPIRHPEKQVDPVNFDRLADPWRRRLFQYVARLVRLRTTADALSVNDTRFLHADFTEGKRVVVWQRGQPESGRLVVVVANFSAFGTPGAPGPTAEYVVPGWPATPPGRRWREVTQDREVAPEWVGREPLFPWEAKVYTLA